MYIPFTINPDINILNLNGGIYKAKILGHNFLIKKINLNGINLHTLTISQFKTTEEARNFLPKAFSYLYWLTVEHNIGLTFPKYIKDDSLELPIDTNVKTLFKQLRLDFETNGDNSNTIEIQNDTIISARSYDSVSVIKGIDLEYSEESFVFTSPEKLIDQENLTLAIELYSNYYYEKTDNARFITLVTVLEALVPDSKVSMDLLDTIKSLRSTVKEIRDGYSRNDEEWKEFDSLLNRVALLKYESIGKSMKNYIFEIIEDHKELGDSKGISNKIKTIYGYRSSLLHSGKIKEEDLKDSLQFLIQFVSKLLKILYISSVN